MFVSSQIEGSNKFKMKTKYITKKRFLWITVQQLTRHSDFIIHCLPICFEKGGASLVFSSETILDFYVPKERMHKTPHVSVTADVYSLLLQSNTFFFKEMCNSNGKPMATLCPNCLFWKINPRLLVPEANALPLEQLAGFYGFKILLFVVK